MSLTLNERKKYTQILGVSLQSSLEDTKAAWRKMAAQYHPDKSTGNLDKMKAINAAWDALSTAGPYTPSSPQNTSSQDPSKSRQQRMMRFNCYMATRDHAIKITEKYLSELKSWDRASRLLKLPFRGEPVSPEIYFHTFVSAYTTSDGALEMTYQSAPVKGINIFPAPYVEKSASGWNIYDRKGETILYDNKRGQSIDALNYFAKGKHLGHLKLVFQDEDPVRFSPDMRIFSVELDDELCNTLRKIQLKSWGRAPRKWWPALKVIRSVLDIFIKRPKQ
jgi:hypothetical protein